MKGKLISILLFLLPVTVVYAQPTGYQKLYLGASDQGRVIPFEQSLADADGRRRNHLLQPPYELTDAGSGAVGFSFYPGERFVYKTMMTRNHEILLIRNQKDTMRVELLEAFNVYYLHLAFRPGHFRMIVNDGPGHRWPVNTLPFREINGGQPVFDLTPNDWTPFEVDKTKIPSDYFISTHFALQNLLARPVLPEEDPNFRNPRRVNYLRLELGDYNFDGQKDYREQKYTDPARWNYFIYTNPATGYVLDTLLSSLDVVSVDTGKKQLFGYKTVRVTALLTQRLMYEFREGALTLVRRQDCVQAAPNAEKMDCSDYEWVAGEWILRRVIKGAE